MDESTLPLTGLKVIDLCLARAGPTCVRHLADWGADVIKVEPTEDARGDNEKRRGFDAQNLHRNKKSIRLNLKSPEGHAVLMKLVKEADVVVENWRPDVKHRLKVSYEDLKKVNPKIILGSNSGFGQEGPIAKRGGVDQIVQGMSGLQTVTGEPGSGPMRTGIAVGDLTGGNLLALGIMMALYQRDRTGQGRWVQSSLLEALIMMMDFQASRYLIDGHVAKPAGNMHPTGDTTGVYPSSDGHFNIAGSSQKMWLRICDVLSKPEWKDEGHKWGNKNARFKDRIAVQAAMAEITKTKPMDYWIKAMEEAGVPCGPIYTMDKVFADEQIKFLGMAQPVKHPELGEIRIVASPLQFVGASRAIRMPTPDPGQHTDEILQKYGYNAGQIQELRKAGAIG
jgi:crotonobetainyl-CoA:carnitine CoA-transferase CaiB-like acyl-CoA transferase